MADNNAQERQIAGLRTAYESGALEKETYEAAVSALLGRTFHAEAQTDSGQIAQGNDNVLVGAGGVFVGGSVGGNVIMGNVYNGPETADPIAALRIYRQVLVHSSHALPLRGVDIEASDAGGSQRPLGLANVYVNLDTTRKEERDHDAVRKERNPLQAGDRAESKPVSALQQVVAQPRLVVTGDPGGGKSTFVNHLAYCLAAHQLQPNGGWLRQLDGWPDEMAALLPLPVVLRDFAATIADSETAATPNTLWAFIETQLRQQNLTFAAAALHDVLEAGGALLLLDGLDEVPTAAARTYVRDAVLAFQQRYPANRYLVTCRILSYQPAEANQPELRLPPEIFPVAELAAFDSEKIDSFIDAWYAELVRVGTVRPVEEAGLVQRLKTAVRRPDLWRLAPNPLLLTVMALVHTHQGRLPDSRALLYENTINMLLWRWEEVKRGGQRDAPPLRQLLLDAGRVEMDLKRLLWRLAFEAHGSSGKSEDSEAVADIHEAQLTRMLETLKPGDWTWAHQVVATMKLRAGLLLERAPGVFTFPHRTFQEYLAGAYLSTQSSFSTQAAELAAAGALWREVVLLAVGRLVHLAGDTDKPYALVNRLCPETAVDSDSGWQNAWLAGDVLLEIGQQRVKEDDWGADLYGRVTERLAQLVAAGELSPRERLAAGDTLAQLGDSRPGVCTPEPALVAIPSGPFLMGEEQHEIVIAQPYAIGKYPVTNAQYRLFIEDGGYTEKWRSCWTDDGWQYADRGKPRLWQDEQYNQPNQPVVGVNWYEAVAYANWLAATTGQPYRLPTEAEWERAARHTDGRTYPWGEDWRDGICNSKELGLARPAAVGSFPGDTAVCGAQDMGGNVNEWCQTRWQDGNDKQYELPYQVDDGRENLEGGWRVTRVWKGGAYDDQQGTYSRCSSRVRPRPSGGGYRYGGFRVVVSPFI